MLWLVMVLLSLGIISRSHFTADLSAFLPSHPTAEQQLLMDQLKDGLASRLILVGIEGADPQTRATLSKTIAQKLRVNPAFVSVNNGEEITAERDREYLFKNRYLLSPAVTPEHFSTDGLRTSISDSIDQIASPAGLLTKSLLPHDPTGEMLQLIDALSGSNRPDMFEGAWTSRDGNTALLLLQTSAAGSDTDAQKLAMQAIRTEFDQAVNIDPAIVKPTLLMTGPGVFSVIARDTIKMQVRAIFIVSSVLIALLLWAVYRSMTALLLGFLPVATGILAGIASVSLVFDVVHGITVHANRTNRQQGTKPQEMGSHCVAYRQAGCAYFCVWFCIATDVRLSRPGAARSVFGCRFDYCCGDDALCTAILVTC